MTEGYASKKYYIKYYIITSCFQFKLAENLDAMR